MESGSRPAWLIRREQQQALAAVADAEFEASCVRDLRERFAAESHREPRDVLADVRAGRRRALELGASSREDELGFVRLLAATQWRLATDVAYDDVMAILADPRKPDAHVRFVAAAERLRAAHGMAGAPTPTAPFGDAE